MSILSLLLLALLSCVAPPVPSPVALATAEGDDPPPLFGVDESQLKGNRVVLNGREVSREEASRRLDQAPDTPRPTAPSLPDRSGRLHLTIIGQASDRAAVLRDLDQHPALRAIKDRLVVRDYDPGHWHTVGVGMVQNGHPTMYLQDESGTVLHRQDTYRGPDALAGAVRKVDPAYRPDKDPDANAVFNPLAFLGLDLAKIPPVAWIVAAAGVFLAIRTLNKGDTVK